MERPKGFVREKGAARVFQFLNELVDKPTSGHVKLRNILKEHKVFNSMDLPRSVRTALAAEILEKYKETHGRIYDGSDFFTLDTYFAINHNLGSDAFADCCRKGLVSKRFLSPDGDNEDLLKIYEESAIKEGWKQDPIKEEKLGFEEKVRKALEKTGFEHVPQDAFDITLLQMDSGNYELGWRTKDENGKATTHQSSIEESYDKEKKLITAQMKQKELLKAGIPQVRVRGRISI